MSLFVVRLDSYFFFLNNNWKFGNNASNTSEKQGEKHSCWQFFFFFFKNWKLHVSLKVRQLTWLRCLEQAINTNRSQWLARVWATNPDQCEVKHFFSGSTLELSLFHDWIFSLAHLFYYMLHIYTDTQTHTLTNTFIHAYIFIYATVFYIDT